MTKRATVLIAFIAMYFLTLFFTRKLGRGDSADPNHVALQTRQDVGSIYGSLCITNGLLAAILAALVF